MGKWTARLSRVFGFRFDEARGAYVLRVVGNRFGPVLRNRPPVDAASAAISWKPARSDIERRSTDRRREIRWVERDRRSGRDRRAALLA